MACAPFSEPGTVRTTCTKSTTRTLPELEEQLSAAAPEGRTLDLVHLSQDSGGLLVPGRDPEGSYWVLVARVV